MRARTESRARKVLTLLLLRISIPYNPDLEHETINGGINGAIKKAIVDNAGIDVARLVAVLGKSRRTVERAIARLKQQGVIEYRGSKKTGGYYAKG